MAKNRVIYQSEALYVSSGVQSTTMTDHAQLRRVQSANYSYTINRQDVNQYGQLARIDAIVTEPPTVNLDFSYYLGDGFNEKALGFRVAQNFNDQFASGHLIASSGRNLYILTAKEGDDAVGSTEASTAEIIGLGNAFLSDYSVDLSVGNIPTVSVTMEASNINAVTNLSTGAVGPNSGYVNFATPAINPELGTSLGLNGNIRYATSGITGAGTSATPTALRPGDVTLTLFNSGIADANTAGDSFHIQTASISIPLSRSPINRLGSKFPFARVVDFPVNATVSINAIVNEVVARNLATILESSNKNDITINVANKMSYRFKNCQLDSESFSSSIGSNKTVDLTFSTQIGGVNDSVNGVFVSGADASANVFI